VVARLFNTVGPRQTGRYGMVIPNFVKQALLGNPLAVYGDGTQTRCFTYVTDVVGQLVALAGEPGAVGEVFNVGNDREEVTILDLARRVVARAGSKSAIELVPYDRAYEEGFEDMLRRVPDTSKLRALTGYEPRVQLDEILDRVIDYFTSDATRL
jgi:UDP-glucose 4-epimerase